MPLIITSPYRRKNLAVEPGVVEGRTVRLFALNGTKLDTSGRPAIGVWEFELYDSTNRNLCRTSGYTPSATSSPDAAIIEGYGADKAIDGIYLSDWTKTCYIVGRTDELSYLEFTFGQDITPTKWRMKPEGQWRPTEGGMRLKMFKNGNWVDITGTAGAGTSWDGSFREFTIPQ